MQPKFHLPIQIYLRQYIWQTSSDGTVTRIKVRVVAQEGCAVKYEHRPSAAPNQTQ